MCEIPIESNYFLAQYLLAGYRSEEVVPAFLLRENLPVVRERLDRIEVVTSPAQEWLGQLPDASIDCFSLSNICELMSSDETGRLFAEVARSAKPGARICFRNLIVPRGVPESLQSEIKLQEKLSLDLIAKDRSFVYSCVRAFVVHGEHIACGAQ
jgi:S-adenosylmethionine-diacylglycerol 3-amino-3-carboxypropyl transferase